MKKQALLLVDDRQDNLDSLVVAFTRADYDVVSARGGQAALDLMKDRWFDVIVTDLVMPRVDGMAIVKAARAQPPPSATIVITAHGSIPSAVEALAEGAVDYLTKPVDLFELRRHVAMAMEKQRLARENQDLKNRLRRRSARGLENMIGESKAIEAVFDQVRRVAPARATVLVTGESGSGKELVARAIHSLSPLKRQPFLAVHCAALSEALIESELFGHERGAYTGAESVHPGRFEIASEGVIFLDEVGEIPLSTQVKLLRVLESREFQRVGGADTLRCNARVIAATQRNLEAEVAAGRFREDLYYRLSVVAIRVPPLRERGEDISLLTGAFLDEFGGEAPPQLTAAVMSHLEAHRWPGNIRELRNAIERLCVMRRGALVDVADLPESIRGRAMGTTNVELEVGMSLDDVERKMIEETLRAVDGNRTKAAELLGVSRRTLQRKLREPDVHEDG